MKSTLAIVLGVCLVASSIPVAAQQIPGPLARTAAREAARLAADDGVGVQATARSDAAGQPRPLELKWNELPQVISGRVVELVAPGGARIRGEVISVRDDALLLDVQNTSDSNAYPKGSASIPRASVTELSLERSRGTWGRNLGTIIGVLTGVVGGAYIAGNAADSAGTGIPLFLALASAMTIGGYYLGKSADKHTTVIRVTQ